jgi:hypothetical protein
MIEHGRKGGGMHRVREAAEKRGRKEAAGKHVVKLKNQN